MHTVIKRKVFGAGVVRWSAITVGVTAFACSCVLALSIISSAPAFETQEITEEGQRQILGVPIAPSVGSSSPSVSVVEYFDYNCPTCKALAPTLHQLLAADAGIAVLYKEWPILGPVSIYAAHCALAAKWQDKYVQAHDALIAGPHLTENSQVEAILTGAGIDMTRLKADLEHHAGTIDALIEHDDEEARAMNLRGTPGLLVGRQLVPGNANLAMLQRVVADARKTRK